MNLYEAVTQLITAITLAFLATFGLVTPETPQNAPVATSTAEVAPLIESASDAIVATNSDPETDKEKSAYELGKAVGYLKGLAEKLPTTTPIVAPPVVQSPQPTPLPTTSPQPMPEPTPEPTPVPTPEPVSNARGEIVFMSPVRATYKANDYRINPDGTLAAGSSEPTDANNVTLGFILYKDDGVTPEQNATVTITAGTSTPSVLNGTGNFGTKLRNGQGAYYYPFYYEFRSAGNHKITFESGNVRESITLTAE